jgi:hypothetical protein
MSLAADEGEVGGERDSQWPINLRKTSYELAMSFIRRWAFSVARINVSPRLISG